ncbi:P-loop containing nucleoside triphosphate hydrolase protein [Mycena alexandri]|uniref:DNA 3'-5' helicase n=1 Tax=Mycena alexandri TaxID=1745969 RepID=A0AAD6XH58_9AGAR|nr:P-loop containing nucleoside triphosphate hydrolase protein [Mycena alexandri]
MTLPNPQHLHSFLNSLNEAQHKAVLHEPAAPLQILAGPGSGKTKVLTSRIAYLILHHSIPASSICAVTFTNKAATEMQERLCKLIGKQRTSAVRMGTFHALCALFLRKFSKVVGIEGNFTVCDHDESKKIIAGLLKPYKDFLASKDISLKDGTVLSYISRAKAKGTTAKEFIAEHKKANNDRRSSDFDPQDDIQRVVGNIYQDYEKALRRSNSLDFDDLLLFGVKLFTEHPPATSWCRHVLVDEFQDTNVTQYELMRAIAAPTKGCVTVVGDPDQSIYGWRSAEVGNLAKMRKDFTGTEQIFLEENYRSTGAILKASLAIVSQDKSRIPKTLLTSHPLGTIPVLRSFPSEQAEANFIAVEIKRLVASMGGVLRWGDFAILLRFSALSRAIESALQKEAIPSAVLGGHKFFERQEIKDILAYLQLVDNPSFVPALTRAINIPSRAIGEKSIEALIARADKTKMSPLDVIERIYDSHQPDIKPAVKHKVGPFVKTVRALRKLATEGTSPPDLIQRLLALIQYEDHLKKTQPEWESRWENVQELITFASEVEHDVNLVDVDTNADPSSSDTPLRLFLQASMLSSEGDNQSEEDSKEKVTISTCHAAKGLEWPVVIIPAVEQGTFPFYRTDDVQEERRLLYVACTRAQTLLYLSHVSKRKVGGETKTKEISEFVASATKEHSGIFTLRTPQLPPPARAVVTRVLGRPDAPEAEVLRRVAEFRKTTRYLDSADDAVGQSEVLYHPALGMGGNARPTATFVSSSSMTMAGASSSNAKPPTRRTPKFGSLVRPASLHPGSSSSSGAQGQILAPSKQNVETPVSTLTVPAKPFVAVQSGVPPPGVPPPVTGGVKRRLGMSGMGRGGMGFPNKKFKPPIL